MKFISKNLNLMVVLRNGISANPIAGVVAIPGLYARFEDGLFESHNPEVIERMQKHAGYNSDFVSVDDQEQARFAKAQSNVFNEPEHDITQIEYGHVGKSMNPRPGLKLTPEMQKALASMAEKMAKDMLVKMSQDMVTEKANPEKTLGTLEGEVEPKAPEVKEVKAAKKSKVKDSTNA
jgi:hypothetical protein